MSKTAWICRSDNVIEVDIYIGNDVIKSLDIWISNSEVKVYGDELRFTTIDIAILNALMAKPNIAFIDGLLVEQLYSL